MFFGHDLKLQKGFTETSEPVLVIFPFCLALMRLKVFRVVNLQLLETLNEIFIFEIFEVSTGGLSVDHRWTTGGKASALSNFPSPVATGGPPMASCGLPWVVSTGALLFCHWSNSRNKFWLPLIQKILNLIQEVFSASRVHS